MRVQVVVPPVFERWIVGFTRLPEEMESEGERVWQTATDVFFDKTQEVVHVITGQLKASGRREVTREGGKLVGQVHYDAPYAVFERRRGGSHDFIARGWELAEIEYRQALPRIYRQVVGSWR